MTSADLPDLNNKKNWLLPLIGAGKLFKAAVLFGASYALRYLRHQDDLSQTLNRWAEAIHVDPDGKYLHQLIDHITGTPVSKLHFAAIALFVYASLFTMEGVGLLLRKRWAEYLVVVITSLLLPLEVYELCHPHRRLVKALVLVANLAILAYLIWNLYKTRHHHHHGAKEVKPLAAAAE